MLEFKSLDTFTIKEIGKVYFVKNTRECLNFDHLIGKEVIIDGNKMVVSSVESYCHVPPFWEGESIGLLVKNND